MKKLKWNFDEVVEYINSKDPIMGELMKSHGKIDIHLPTDYYLKLCRSIVGQQVSVKAASSIFQKLLNQFGGTIEPAILAKSTVPELRTAGLSQQKASYIIDLSAHFAKDPQRFYHLENLKDEEVIESLVAIKGIGVWTAQMFLMFTLGRPDLFAPDDLGLRNAIQKLYSKRKPMSKKQLEQKALKWQPYRTFACLYLWKSLDNMPKKTTPV